MFFFPDDKAIPWIASSKSSDQNPKVHVKQKGFKNFFNHPGDVKLIKVQVF
jgi:hypothetical protein